MTQTIRKSIGEGFAKGELYAALAYDTTDRFGGMKIKGISFSITAGISAIQVGDSTTAQTLTASEKAIDIYVTTVATASTVKAARINLVATVGSVSTPSANLQALNANVDVNVVTGSSITTIYAQMTYGASGDARGGMASALCAELKLPGKTLAVVGGSYYIADLEMWTPASYLSCTNNTAHITAFQRFAIWGDATAVASFEDYGYLFNLNGFTSASGNLFYANTIRCIVGSTAWYIPLSSAQGSYTTAYPIISTYVGTAIDLTPTLTSTTGQNILRLNVTDSAALASDYSRAIYINWTKTGAQTGGYVNPFSIDFAATTAACTEVALESHYITQTGNKLTGNVAVWQAYLEDVGSAAANVFPIEIGRVCTNTGSSRDSFARFKTHSGTAKSVFYIEGTSNAMATNLFTFCGTDTSPFQRGTPASGSIIGRITINHESTPGGTSTTYYIPVYQ